MSEWFVQFSDDLDNIRQHSCGSIVNYPLHSLSYEFHWGTHIVMYNCMNCVIARVSPEVFLKPLVVNTDICIPIWP